MFGVRWWGVGVCGVGCGNGEGCGGVGGSRDGLVKRGGWRGGRGREWWGSVVEG